MACSNGLLSAQQQQQAALLSAWAPLAQRKWCAREVSRKMKIANLQ